jgi:hypothetical protein
MTPPPQVGLATISGHRISAATNINAILKKREADCCGLVVDFYRQMASPPKEIRKEYTLKSIIANIKRCFQLGQRS